MARVLFDLNQVPDPLEGVVEPVAQTPEPVAQTPDPLAPVSGGRVLFTLDPEAEAEPTFFETVGRGLKGEAELALTVGTSIALEPIAGLTGLFQGMFSDEPGAAEAGVQLVRNFAFKPGPAGQEIAKGIGQIAETLTPDAVLEFGRTLSEEFKAGEDQAIEAFGPGVATALFMLPVAALEATVGYFTIKQLRKAATTLADEAIQETEDALRQSDTATFRTDLQPEDKSMKQIADDFGKQNTQNLIDEINPDPVRVQAAKDLGVDVNPSSFSNNASFIALEQGLKSKPGNQLRQIENEAIEKLGERADELILKMGGEVEKGLLDVAVKAEFTKVIGELAIKAAKDYKTVNETIPKALPVIPATSRLYIEKRLEDLGGIKRLLNQSEKELADVLGLPKKPTKEIPDIEDIELPSPTYGALDQVRRNVGNAIEKKPGPYTGDEEAILDNVYGVLSNDQQGVADLLGVGPVYQRARKQVQIRKDVEKKSLELFGRDLKDSLIPKLATAGKQIGSGEITRFKKLMNALPPSQRQAAAATMLNDLFTFGARTAAPLGGGFIRAFESLARNPTLKKAVFDELPPEALKTFNKIGQVSTGLFRSKALQNNSGTANAILANLDNGSIAQKLLRSRRLASPFSKFGRALSFTAAFLKKTLPKKTEMGADLLTSPAFKKSLEDAALGKAVSAENITKTPAFKRWFTLEDPPTQNQIAAIGFIPWLLDETDPRLNLTLSPAEEAGVEN